MVWKERSNKKLLVILGANASGKSSLAVWLAKKFNGEIISADSRQVYKGMDLGSGKITKKEMEGVRHYLLSVASPKRRFSVAQYQKKANIAIKKIYKKNKLPILCGGTGFYIQAITKGIIFPHIRPDWNLRKKLEKDSSEKLFRQLEKLDPVRANNVDKHNKRRLIRAIEIVLKTKRPVPVLKKEQKFDILFLGIKREKNELKERIQKRLEKRLKQGMIKEVKKLRQSGLSWKRLEEFGLEYRFIAYYLQKKITYGEMIDRLQKEIEQYAKRQMTWFKRNRQIHWIKDKKTANTLIKKFLNY